MQEAPLDGDLPPIDPRRLMPPVSYTPGREAVTHLADILKAAKRPVILVGRVSRSEKCWNERIALAEALGARVLTDLKVGAGFPTDHPLSLAPPGVFPLPSATATVQEADVVLSLDWVALHGILPAAGHPKATIVHASLDHTVHNGWSMDHQALPPVDHLVPADPDALVAALCEVLGVTVSAAGTAAYSPVPVRSHQPLGQGDEPLGVPDLAHWLREAVGDRPVSLLHLPLSWDGAYWPFRHPLDFIGSDGGGGIGGGPGSSVGAALALRGSGRLPISICGDGDFLMGVTALWTAVHYKIPALSVIANNRSFYNDEVHQERVARMRGRPVENKWTGQKMSDPEIDLAAMARAQGAKAFGPVTTREGLGESYRDAIAAVEAGYVAVIDVRVEPGYTPAMAGALTRESGSAEK
jgi:thiamine pyrophosphate-dependent acetolactate synthase large subunit-like protein